MLTIRSSFLILAFLVVLLLSTILAAPIEENTTTEKTPPSPAMAKRKHPPAGDPKLYRPPVGDGISQNANFGQYDGGFFAFIF